MKFIKALEESFAILNEEEPAPPADPAAAPVDPAAPVADPAAAAAPASAEEEGGEDDVVKLRTDLVELVRKALIMAPKHIDDIDFAKLTELVDVKNVDKMEELVSRIINNNYPHPNL